MALKLYNETDIEAIADAIRGKNGSSDTYTVSQMAQAIDDIPSGGGDNDIDNLLTNTLTEYVGSASSVRDYAFYNNTALESVELTGNTTIGASAFRGCTGLTNFSLLGRCSRVAGYVFNGVKCPIVLRDAGEIGTESFRSYSGSAVDIGQETAWFGTGVFNSAANLATLVLRKTSGVIAINNINVLASTPFASGGTGGTLYVPQSLISSYQSATNWSTILGYTNNQIKSIESTHTDPNAPIDLTTHYADGTLIAS